MRRGWYWGWQLAWVASTLWLGGFILFSMRAAPVVPDRQVDGAVVLTGGAGRIEAAAALLDHGQARRLLISGVHAQVTPADLERTAGLSAEQLACCIDLGRAAIDTRGNAVETARWARAHDYKSLIVVTADYHMPRALLVFHQVLPDIDLVPYPVGAPAGLYGRAKEYSKYLASLLAATLDLE